MTDWAFINGRFLPLEDAMVSIEDRGFLFGDGVYEVVRTYHGVPFQLDAHLTRLDCSARAIDLTNPFSDERWRELVQEGVRLGGYEESKIYIQITRGTAPRDHSFPPDTPPTVVMIVRAMRPLDLAVQSRGVGVTIVEDVRWGRCNIKSLNLLPNVMAHQRAKEAGAFEAIFLRDGVITEGAVSNVMAVRNGIVLTAPECEHILSGITRAVVLELARKAGLPVREQAISIREFRSADEVFLTGTTVEVLPVVRVDDALVGDGTPGPITRLLSARFRSVTDSGAS
jgi:D-alanine transaminase